MTRYLYFVSGAMLVLCGAVAWAADNPQHAPKPRTVPGVSVPVNPPLAPAVPPLQPVVPTPQVAVPPTESVIMPTDPARVPTEPARIPVSPGTPDSSGNAMQP